MLSGICAVIPGAFDARANVQASSSWIEPHSGIAHAWVTSLLEDLSPMVGGTLHTKPEHVREHISVLHRASRCQHLVLPRNEIGGSQSLHLTLPPLLCRFASALTRLSFAVFLTTDTLSLALLRLLLLTLAFILPGAL